MRRGPGRGVAVVPPLLGCRQENPPTREPPHAPPPRNTSAPSHTSQAARRTPPSRPPIARFGRGRAGPRTDGARLQAAAAGAKGLTGLPRRSRHQWQGPWRRGAAGSRLRGRRHHERAWGRAGLLPADARRGGWRAAPGGPVRAAWGRRRPGQGPARPGAAAAGGDRRPWRRRGACVGRSAAPRAARGTARPPPGAAPGPARPAPRAAAGCRRRAPASRSARPGAPAARGARPAPWPARGPPRTRPQPPPPAAPLPPLPLLDRRSLRRPSRLSPRWR
jgi:hypothetical protein